MSGATFIRGKYGVEYDVSPGVAAVDHHLWALRKNFGPAHPDVDLLLDARNALRTKTYEKGAALVGAALGRKS